MTRMIWTIAILGTALVACDDNPGPDTADRARSPQYFGPDDEISSGERGNIMVTEVGFAGSVADDGTWDPDDVFLELQNRHPRTLNVTGWHVILEGDVVRTLIIPPKDPSCTSADKVSDPDRCYHRIAPNAFFVIASKDDGAFGAAADLIMSDLEFGQTYIYVDIRDANLKKMENAGHDGRRVFSGGYDTYATRTMERVQLIFGNRGNASRNWHAFSDNTTYFSDTDTENPGVAQGYRARTFASPGVANSRDYSGSAAAGNFE